MTQSTPSTTRARPWRTAAAIGIVLLIVPATRELLIEAAQVSLGIAAGLLIGLFIFGAGRSRR